VDEGEALFKGHLDQIAQIDLVARPPEHDKENDGGGNLQIVEIGSKSVGSAVAGVKGNAVAGVKRLAAS